MIFDKFLGGDAPKRFVIRLKGRDVIHRGMKRACGELAQVLLSPHKATVVKYYEGGREKVRTLWYNAVSVELPRRPERLFW